MEVPLPATDDGPFEFTDCTESATWDVEVSYYHNLVVTEDDTMYAINPFDGDTCAVRFSKTN